MIGAPRSPNAVREALTSGTFLVTVEIVTPDAAEEFEGAMRPALALARAVRDDPRIHGLAITDRVKSDSCHDPLLVGRRVADLCAKAPMIHWAGKDRTLGDFEADLERAEPLGLENFLLITGDKLRHRPADRPVRYLDSVVGLHAARQRAPALLLAAAACPFKYREEELLNQYLKAAKKLRAGADVLITQIGWDMPKFQELRLVLVGRGHNVPLVAELLYLTPARSRYIRRVGLAGVTITDDLAQKLEEEAASPDAGRAAAIRRLALQIVGVRLLGYAGVQISGLHAYAKIVLILQEVERLTRECATLDDWTRAWRETLMLADGRLAHVAPPDGLYVFEAVRSPAGDAPGAPHLPGWLPEMDPTRAALHLPAGPAASRRTGEDVKFRRMDLLDRVAFHEGSPGARIAGPLLRRLDGRSGVGAVLLWAERSIKGPLLGCQTCGFCRIPHTAYVCPETCPKGLANGPCGGTRDNVCEFGDRECIHNSIYRVSKAAGLLHRLEEDLIPPVPEATWGSCSWVTHFRGEGPKVVRLPGPPTRPG